MSRRDELMALMRKRVLVLDGAMGTALQAQDLSPADFGGAELEGCNENLILTKPEAISKVHAGYLEAGADIVETGTFGAIGHVLAEYGLSAKAREINLAGARLARAEADRFSAPGRPRFVAGALGPGTKTISVTGGITFDEVRRFYREAAEGLIEGGSDLLLLETQQDTLNIKASLFGFADAFEAAGRDLPVMLSVSIETMGTMLGGQTAEALYYAVSHFDLLGIGLNCATGPSLMTDHIRTLSGLSHVPVICYPNAGLPDENGEYNEDPESLARKLHRFCEEGWVNVVGGCCGTTPAHIRAIAAAAEGLAPRVPVDGRAAALSGLEAMTVDEDKRPILVGERTNVIGSRAFKKLIAAEGFEEGAELGRKQVRGGAQVLDVCLANPDRDEKADMSAFLDILTKKTKVPIMIDSTDAAVVEEALKRCPGKSIINSINLEDGEERFRRVAGLARRYGAAVIVGTIDEDKKAGMAVSRARKLEIARRTYRLLTEELMFPPEDIVFDPLVFPCATGDANYVGSAVETIEGIRLIKREFPRAKTVLGISNVSFGLPPAGREALNAVYLFHCVGAGLDMAIVNSQKLARYATLPDEEKRLADELLGVRPPSGDDPIAAFAAHFRDAKPKEAPEERLKLPVPERLARSVVEGSKEGLIADLDALLAEGSAPLEIINGPLMKGMDEVGRRFAANELIVAEVLQSAEVMKSAVAHLEPLMDKASSSSRGKLLLATVKGDVHDIGKNLVHIIFKNNGYEIIDLGIKIAPETLIAAAAEHSPDLLGLSGLLVKSAQQMVATGDDLKKAGVTIPILVGGAALTPRFTASKIAPSYENPVLYAKDAMMGLDLANRLRDPARVEDLLKKNRETQARLVAESLAPAASAAPAGEDKGTGLVLSRDHDIPTPPDIKTHVFMEYDLEEILKYVNPVMLYGKHMGLKGNFERLIKAGDKKALELAEQIRRIEDEVLDKRLIHPKGVVRFLPAMSEGDAVVLYDSASRRVEIGRLDFPRQKKGDRLCLADYVLPAAGGKMDYIAVFIVTCGHGISALSAKWRDEGHYLKSHGLQALSVECAEAFAELLHDKLRSMWGIPDPLGMSIKEKFQARYRGVRVSYGYPACPDMEHQARLWPLLEPEKNIEVRLTENFMMDPEASVSAIVFHHPQARYFGV